MLLELKTTNMLIWKFAVDLVSSFGAFCSLLSKQSMCLSLIHSVLLMVIVYLFNRFFLSHLNYIVMVIIIWCQNEQNNIQCVHSTLFAHNVRCCAVCSVYTAFMMLAFIRFNCNIVSFHISWYLHFVSIIPTWIK